LLDQASEHLQHALEVFRDQRDPVNEADALSRIGELSLLLGALAEAAAYHQQALDIYQRIDHPSGIAYELGNLGEITLERGDCQRAISYLQEALVLFDRNGHRHGQILAQRNLAQALIAAGEPAAARAELQKALSLAAETGHTHEQANVHASSLRATAVPVSTTRSATTGSRPWTCTSSSTHPKQSRSGLSSTACQPGTPDQIAGSPHGNRTRLRSDPQPRQAGRSLEKAK
jgi:tetratricopeptide (TPR) repeat protein